MTTQTSNNSATNSAVHLLQGLASQLKAAADKLASGETDDTTDLQELANGIALVTALLAQLNSQVTAPPAQPRTGKRRRPARS